MTYCYEDLIRALRHLSRDLDASNAPRFAHVIGVGEVEVSDALLDAADSIEELMRRVEELEDDPW